MKIVKSAKPPVFNKNTVIVKKILGSVNIVICTKIVKNLLVNLFDAIRQ